MTTKLTNNDEDNMEAVQYNLDQDFREQLENAIIKAGNIANLAKRLKVSRQAIYYWLDGRPINWIHKLSIQKYVRSYDPEN